MLQNQKNQATPNVTSDNSMDHVEDELIYKDLPLSHEDEMVGNVLSGLQNYVNLNDNEDFQPYMNEYEITQDDHGVETEDEHIEIRY